MILPRNSIFFSTDFSVFVKSVLHMNHPQITEIGTGLGTGSRPGEWPLRTLVRVPTQPLNRQGKQGKWLIKYPVTCKGIHREF